MVSDMGPKSDAADTIAKKRNKAGDAMAHEPMGLTEAEAASIVQRKGRRRWKRKT